MKNTNLAKAVALASFAFAGQAFALAPSVTPDVVVNISGASAQQITLAKIVTDYCSSDLNTFLDGSAASPATAGKNWRSFFCTMSADSHVPATLQGKKVLFNTRSKGGSIYGVVPVGKGWNVEYMNIGYNGGSHCTLSSGKYYCDVSTTPSTALITETDGSKNCPHDNGDYSAGDRQTLCSLSDAGVSDVEPKIFAGDNLPAGWVALTSAENSALTIGTEYGSVFGIAVTNDVYSALQVAQSTTGVPSLTKAEVKAILAGTIKNWKQIDGSTSTTIAAGTGRLQLCKRTAGSGTQASMNAYFLDNPCGKSYSGNVSMVKAQSYSTYKVVDNSATGDMKACLNTAATGTTKFGGIGFLAVENQPTASDSWKYIAIDGVEPTVANAVTSAYPIVYEVTIQWPTATPAGAKLDALKMIKQDSSKPVTFNLAGVTGVVGLQQNGNAFTLNPLDPSYPTARATRGGYSCRSPKASAL